MDSITLTESAATKIASILAEEKNPKINLRAFVQGGGCSGLSYGFTLDEEQNDDDMIIEKNGVNILIDAMSFQYLTGATIDFKEDLGGSRFTIDNPSASSTCGCGSSFSV